MFNINGNPTAQINEQTWSQQIQDPYDYSIQTDYGVTATCYFNPNDVQLIFNPAIINSSSTGATIQNKSIDMVVGYLSQSNSVFLNCTSSNPAVFSYYTQKDPNEGGMAETPILYVRVSFDVVPNNGAKKTTIVKTFLLSTQL